MLLLVLFQACFLLDWAEPTVTWDTAVAPASDRWLPRSAVWAAPAGRFAPLADGGWIGLSAMVCAVDWSTGQIGADTEIEPDQVEVITDYDASRVVVITPHGAHAWRPTDGADEAHPTDAAPLDARLTDDGVVVLLDDPAGCAIAWGDARADAPCAAPGTWAAAPDGSAAWLPGEAGLVEVSPGGSITWPDLADHVAYDAERHVVVAARGSRVRAWRREGRAPLWTADLGARVLQLQAVPARAAIAALVDRPGGAGLVYLDVATGEATDALQADEPARGFSVSADGRRLALTLDGRVVLFDESGGNAAN